MIFEPVLETQLSKTEIFVRETAKIILVSFLIGLSGLFALRLPFTPIPIALQPHAVLLAGMVLGSRQGFLAVALLLLEGALGFPVFSLGASGITHFFMPSGGYLLAYPFAAFLTGYLVERFKSPLSSTKLFVAICSGNALIYMLGALHLSRFIGIEKALFLGVLPFLITDFLKNVMIVKAVHFFQRSTQAPKL